MDLETKQLLDRLTELTEENNKILHKIQKHTRWTMIFGIIKWVLIIGVTIGSYFALLPYINQVVDTYQSFQSMQAKSSGLMDYLKYIQNSVVR